MLAAAVERARPVTDGVTATYIPELAQVDPEAVSAAVTLTAGPTVAAGDADHHRFTLQSSAKVVLLAGLLEELGEERVFARVGTEPSGASFASIARLETHGPIPPNPLVNAGAIALCSLIPGDLDAKLAWLAGWLERLAGEPLGVNRRVLASEAATGDRNRAIAYFLKSQGTLEGDVETVLTTYFTLCSVEAGVVAASHIAAVLAGGGAAPGGGPRRLSRSRRRRRRRADDHLRHVRRVGGAPAAHRPAGQERGLRGDPGGRHRPRRHRRRQPAGQRQGRQRPRSPHPRRAVARAGLALRAAVTFL